MQPGVVPGAVLELHAARAAGGTSPGVNDPLTTQWFDTSGSGNHGTLLDFTGTPWATGPDRLALDGTNDHVSVPGANLGSGSFSWEFWVRPDTIASAWYRSLLKHETYPTNGLRIGFKPSGWRPWTSQDGGTLNPPDWASPLSTVAANHIVVTYDAATNRWWGYHNGAAHDFGTGTYVETTGPALIGRAIQEYYDGDVYAVRRYSCALTAAQVAQNYHAGPLWTPARAVPVIGSPIVRGFGGTP